MPDSDEQASQDRSILSSAPSFLQTPSFREMQSSLEEGIDTDLDDCLPVEPQRELSIPAIFLGSKKVQKSWV